MAGQRLYGSCKSMVIALTAVWCLCCTGCSYGSYHLSWINDYMEKGTVYGETVDAFFTALDNRDAEAMRGLFSSYVQREDLDLDEQIDALMALYPGPTELNLRNRSAGGYFHNDHGKHFSQRSDTFALRSNGVYYWCYFEMVDESDKDQLQLGISKINFFDIYAWRSRLDDEWQMGDAEGTGLNIFQGRDTGKEIRVIYESPYCYTTEPPLDQEEVIAFLKENQKYSDFVRRFGTPCASRIFAYYELPPENGQPRYLQLSYSEIHNEIYGASVVDELEWLFKLWEPEE